MTIYQELKSIGAEITNHYSDLYVKKTPEVMEIIQKMKTKVYYQTFRSNIDGEMWVDIPMGFDPFWDEVA